MRVKTEKVKGVPDHLLTYSFPVKNFNPDNVRRSLRRAYQRAQEGPDGCLEIKCHIKNGQEWLPDIKKLGQVFENYTLGTVTNGCLEIFDPDCTREQAEAGEDCIIYLYLAAVASMQVSYRTWEPKPKEA